MWCFSEQTGFISRLKPGFHTVEFRKIGSDAQNLITAALAKEKSAAEALNGLYNDKEKLCFMVDVGQRVSVAVGQTKVGNVKLQHGGNQEEPIPPSINGSEREREQLLRCDVVRNSALLDDSLVLRQNAPLLLDAVERLQLANGRPGDVHAVYENQRTSKPAARNEKPRRREGTVVDLWPEVVGPQRQVLVGETKALWKAHVAAETSRYIKKQVALDKQRRQVVRPTEINAVRAVLDAEDAALRAHEERGRARAAENSMAVPSSSSSRTKRAKSQSPQPDAVGDERKRGAEAAVAVREATSTQQPSKRLRTEEQQDLVETDQDDDMQSTHVDDLGDARAAHVDNGDDDDDEDDQVEHADDNDGKVRAAPGVRLRWAKTYAVIVQSLRSLGHESSLAHVVRAAASHQKGMYVPPSDPFEVTSVLHKTLKDRLAQQPVTSAASVQPRRQRVLLLLNCPVDSDFKQSISWTIRILAVVQTLLDPSIKLDIIDARRVCVRAAALRETSQALGSPPAGPCEAICQSTCNSSCGVPASAAGAGQLPNNSPLTNDDIDLLVGGDEEAKEEALRKLDKVAAKLSKADARSMLAAHERACVDADLRTREIDLTQYDAVFAMGADATSIATPVGFAAKHAAKPVFLGCCNLAHVFGVAADGSNPVMPLAHARHPAALVDETPERLVHGVLELAGAVRLLLGHNQVAETSALRNQTRSLLQSLYLPLQMAHIAADADLELRRVWHASLRFGGKTAADAMSESNVPPRVLAGDPAERRVAAVATQVARAVEQVLWSERSSETLLATVAKGEHRTFGGVVWRNAVRVRFGPGMGVNRQHADLLVKHARREGVAPRKLLHKLVFSKAVLHHKLKVRCQVSFFFF
jgi:hypothetical protein